MPLFDEARRVVQEDPRIRDTAAYSSVLAAVREVSSYRLHGGVRPH